MLASRVTSRPFRTRGPRLRDLELGVSATGGRLSEGLGGVDGRTVTDRRVFFPQVYINGHHFRLGYDASWEIGALTMKGEYR